MYSLHLTPEKQEELRRLFRGSFPDNVNSRLVDWLSELGGLFACVMMEII